MQRTCNSCGSTLEAGRNWSPSRVRKNDYVCSKCNAVRRHYPDLYHSCDRANPTRLPTFRDGRIIRLRNKVRKHYRGPDRKVSQIREGFVYAIVNDRLDPWVKIGHSTDPVKRLSQYQTGSPYRDYKLLTYRYFKDRIAAERLVHDAASIAAAKREGEWFSLPHDEAVRIIRELNVQ